MTANRIALIGSIALNALLVAVFIDRKVKFNRSQQPQSKWADAYNDATAEMQSHFPLDSNDVVFVGTSLTAGFPTEMLPGKNRGIASNETYHLLGRIESIARHKPKKIFIEIGTNDFHVSKISVDSVFNNWRRIVEKIKEASPRTEIYTQSLFPVSMGYAWYNDSIVKLNGKLNALPNYIDLYPHFVKGGVLDRALTYDGIHLNYRGYQLWQKSIDIFINMF